MNEQQFLENINSLKEFARGNNGVVTREDVVREFGQDNITPQQLDMVMSYFQEKDEAAQEQGIPAEKLKELEAEDEAFTKIYSKELESGLGDEYASIFQLAKEYAGRGIALADLVQEGNLAYLEKAQGDVDEAAIRSVFEEMTSAESGNAREAGRTLARINRIQATADRLYEELNRKVTLEEIASELAWSVEEVKELSAVTGDALENVVYA